MLEGILWILKTGARWRDLPKEFPSPSTCWRRLQLWEEEEIWLNIWRAFLSELDKKGRLVWEEAFIDASFAPAKKGAPTSAKPSVERVRSGWWWSGGKGVPLGGRVLPADPAEVTLVGVALEAVEIPGKEGQKPKRLIADKAYDSKALQEDLAMEGIELISPHRCNNKHKTQDGRKLRRYRKRWKIERTFAWLGNYRRLVVRYERKVEIYEAFLQIACLLITLRHL